MSVMLMVQHKNVLLTFVILCGAFLVYWRFYVDELKSHRLTLKEIVLIHTTKEVGPILEIHHKNEKELLFDELLRYILHPKGHCRAPIALGGVRFMDNRLEGDKMICLDPGPSLEEDCLVLSFGVDIEMSFEESIRLAFHCVVVAFDPSMNKPDHLHSEGIWFFDRSLGDFDETVVIENEAVMTNTFESILRELEIENRTFIDVVKMDIEGGEYSVLENILKNGILNRVNHLCVQIHLNEERDWNTTLQLLKAIEEESGMVHFSTKENSRSSREKVPGLPHRQEQLFFEMAWTRIPKQESTTEVYTTGEMEAWLAEFFEYNNEV